MQDYVEGMWMMLQQDQPDDFVLATGHMHSVREFVVAAFKYIGKEIQWEGKGDTEIGREKGSGIIRYEELSSIINFYARPFFE